MRKARGFTLIELIIVAAIIVILAYLSMLGLGRWRQRAKVARIGAELTEVATAVTQFAEDNNYQYPADTDRSVPPGLEKYLAGGTWPESVWPNGVYDWDNWIHPGLTSADPNKGKQIYQLTYRLCGLSDPIEWCSDPLIFPNFVRQSGIFYCISGPCVPHRDNLTAPGYCVNCADKTVNY